MSTEHQIYTEKISVHNASEQFQIVFFYFEFHGNLYLQHFKNYSRKSVIVSKITALRLILTFLPWKILICRKHVFKQNVVDKTKNKTFKSNEVIFIIQGSFLSLLK